MDVGIAGFCSLESAASDRDMFGAGNGGIGVVQLLISAVASYVCVNEWSSEDRRQLFRLV